MGYFPNGTSFDYYYDEFCDKCIHDQDENNPCPIIGIHMMFNYELCNETDHPGKVMLDAMIPCDEIDNKKCKMFINKEDV